MSNMPAPPALSVADAFVKQLYAWGVRCIWGVIGDAIIHLVDAIFRHGDIRYMDMRHEESASLAASAYAKCTGHLGVCIATSGPGTAHLINGLADAWADCAPVLAITGQVDRQHVGTTYKQYIDQQRLMTGVCSLSLPIEHQSAALQVLVRAMRTSLASQMPVHVEVAKDLWTKTTAEAVHSPEPYLDTNPISSAQVIKQAAELFASAERPVIYIGRGARNAIGAVIELAERTAAPVVRTLGAAGFTPGLHPQVVGGIGSGGSEAADTLIHESDCMLRIGATWWPKKLAPIPARVIAIDMAPSHVAVGIEPAFGVVGDAGIVLRHFLAQNPFTGRLAWNRRVAEVKRAWDASMEQECQSTPDGVAPARVVRAIEAVADANAVITVDVGEHTLWFNRVFRGKGQDLIFSGKWRTMGFGLPAAAAAKVAYPDRPVIALVGDGGLGMVLADFVSLVKHKLPVVIVVLNNGSLALEKHRMECMGMAPVGTALHNPDFAGIAGTCGGAGYRVTQHDELDAVLRRCVSLEIPALVDVTTADTMLPTVPAQV